MISSTTDEDIVNASDSTDTNPKIKKSKKGSALEDAKREAAAAIAERAAGFTDRRSGRRGSRGGRQSSAGGEEMDVEDEVVERLPTRSPNKRRRA